MAEGRKFIPPLEIENAQIKWAWSNFGGRKAMYNEEGEHNFQLILDEPLYRQLKEDGWSVRESDGPEDGDPSEYLLKVKISYRFEDPRIYLIKNNRKIKAREDDLQDITRTSTKQIDVIIKPSFWERNDKVGISAYVDEMYVVMNTSRFADAYADYVDVAASAAPTDFGPPTDA